MRAAAAVCTSSVFPGCALICNEKQTCNCEWDVGLDFFIIVIETSSNGISSIIGQFHT